MTRWTAVPDTSRRPPLRCYLWFGMACLFAWPVAGAAVALALWVML